MDLSILQIYQQIDKLKIENFDKLIIFQCSIDKLTNHLINSRYIDKM